MTTKTPVLYIVFNRLDVVKKSFAAIRKGRPEKLYVAADGPRVGKTGERDKCEAVRRWVLDHIDWECEVRTLLREHNLGCGRGPKEAVDWLFDNEERGIVLEDDCVASPSFFSFCDEMLEKYRDDSRISIVCGSNFDRDGVFRSADADSFFSAVPYTWGWATWKRNWLGYDYTMSDWNRIDKSRLLRWMFRETEHRNYWRYVFDATSGTSPYDIWDYQFFFSCYRRHQLAIVPNVNLISNIGVGADATHTSRNAEYRQSIGLHSLDFPLRYPARISRNFGYDAWVMDKCYGRVKGEKWYVRTKRFIKRALQK